MEASIPGSLPGTASRNGRPEGTYYTHWRGRPLPVVPYTERNLGGRPPSPDSKRGKCTDCGTWPQSKKHHRQCLGVELPPSPGHPGTSATAPPERQDPHNDLSNNLHMDMQRGCIVLFLFPEAFR